MNVWWLAVRPKTLPLSLAPVLLGTTIAYTELQQLNVLLSFTILVTAALIQIGTNLYNDVGDAKRGADNLERLGPLRVVSAGFLSAKEVSQVAQVFFALALILGLYLVKVGGIAILLIGVASLLAGIAYTNGRLPIAYTMFGELFVFLFFGLLAVSGTTYLISGEWVRDSFITGAALGLLAAAVLLVNNYRDINGDKKVAKNTLAVTLGVVRTKFLYVLFMLLALLLILEQHAITVLVMLIPTVYLCRLIYLIPHGRGLNKLLERTVQLQFLFTITLVGDYIWF